MGATHPLDTLLPGRLHPSIDAHALGLVPFRPRDQRAISRGILIRMVKIRVGGICARPLQLYPALGISARTTPPPPTGPSACGLMRHLCVRERPERTLSLVFLFLGLSLDCRSTNDFTANARHTGRRVAFGAGQPSSLPLPPPHLAHLGPPAIPASGLRVV